jgi:hypothetical protein
MIVASSIGTSPVPFLYFAEWAFAIHSVIVLLRTLIVDGVSWRLGFSAVACLAVGIGIFSMLGIIEVKDVAWPRWLFQSIDEFEEDRSRTFSSVQPVDHLATAAQLIFVKETQESLGQARRQLLSIPQGAAEYKSSQALLRVAQSRQDQLKIRKDVQANPKHQLKSSAAKKRNMGFASPFKTMGQHLSGIFDIVFLISESRMAGILSPIRNH